MTSAVKVALNPDTTNQMNIQIDRMVFNSIFNSISVHPFPNDKFKTLPNWKSLQRTAFKLDENGRKFSKWVENTVAKGEITHYIFENIVEEVENAAFGNGLIAANCILH